jgi:carbonic anhydrase/acetyltransferase-like protein (isoleucine patch superfamily)
MIASFSGSTPAVDDGAWVADNATVLGDVEIAGGAGIWFGAVVRADVESIRIGRDTNVQDNCVLHADPGTPLSVGDRVSIGHAAVLHGCTIDSDVLVGMGAIVMNNARIGSGSLVAAGALVLEGTVIPSGSLVAGVPGKVRRPLTDEELEHVRANARHYADLARRQGAATPGG